MGLTATWDLELWWLQGTGHQPNLLTTLPHACYFAVKIGVLIVPEVWFDLVFSIGKFTIWGRHHYVSFAHLSCWKKEGFFLQVLDLVPEDLSCGSDFGLVVILRGTSIFPSVNGKDWTRTIGLQIASEDQDVL